MKKLFYIICIAVLFTSCSEDENKKTGTIVFEFDARAGLEDDFETGTTYENQLGQEFQLSAFTYTIKNIRLKREDGSYAEDPLHAEYSVDESGEESTLVTIENIPAGKYTAVEFTIGGNETYMELTGTSPNSTETDDAIHYAVSGIANQKVKTIEFHDHIATVSGSTEPEVHLIIDVLKFFTGTTDIDFSQQPICTDGMCAEDFSNNYVETFVFDHIHS